MNTKKETIKWNPKWFIKKYSSVEAFEKGEAEEKVEVKGNVLTKAGINHLWKLVCGDEVDEFGENSAIIVGTGSGTATDADTELTFTSKAIQKVKGGFPTFGTDEKATWSAVFDGSTANQKWNEMGLLTKATGGILLNRLVDDQGTKASGQIWEIVLEISLS